MTSHRICEVHPLLPPAALIEQAPLGPRAAAVVSNARAAIGDVLAGRDDRIVVIVGPCSIHDVQAALDYGGRLKVLADGYAQHLIVVMRSYLEKPRTCVGWKGFINDPDLDQSHQINKGLRLARRLLLELSELGMPAATEFLEMQVPAYMADLVSWASIGARTVESQVHRELASGLPMPVGFKNRRDGSIESAVQAVLVARAPHWFPAVTEEGTAALVRTAGNEMGHVVLRGGSRSGPNYSRPHIEHACAQLAASGLPDRVMVDFSHDNCGNQHLRQLEAAASVCDQIAAGDGRVVGVLIESHLVEGRQAIRSGSRAVYGQSVTDSCLSIAQTWPVLEQLAAAQHRRRRMGEPSATEPGRGHVGAAL